MDILWIYCGYSVDIVWICVDIYVYTDWTITNTYVDQIGYGCYVEIDISLSLYVCGSSISDMIYVHTYIGAWCCGTKISVCRVNDIVRYYSYINSTIITIGLIGILILKSLLLIIAVSSF